MYLSCLGSGDGARMGQDCGTEGQVYHTRERDFFFFFFSLLFTAVLLPGETGLDIRVESRREGGI